MNSFDESFDHELPSVLEEPTSHHRLLESCIVATVLFIVFVLGILGNGIIVLIFLRHKAMRHNINIYVFSLALGDLLEIICCLPFNIIMIILETYPWGEVMCKINHTSSDISIGVSIFTLIVLSADRYFATVHPLRKLHTKTKTVIRAAIIWILAALLALPDAVFSRVEEFTLGYSSNKVVRICIPYPKITHEVLYAKCYESLTVLIYYIIPLCIIVTFHVLMAIHFRAHAYDTPGESREPQNLAEAEERKQVSKMVCIFVFLFFICFLPLHVYSLWLSLNPNAVEEYNKCWHIIKFIAACFSFAKTCVNPIALYWVSSVFRDYFNRYLCCRDLRRPWNGEMRFSPLLRKHSQASLDTVSALEETNAHLVTESTNSSTNSATFL